jgi:hypothetical protein
MTMLASKQALKRLSDGKIPPPPIVQSWEPGQKMVQLLDFYLLEHTKLMDPDPTTLTDGNQRLIAQARMIEREILLVWRHAIATNHGLYLAEPSGIEPVSWPSTNNTKPSCCVRCRASIRVTPCPKCQSVLYCGTDCRTRDYEKGHSRICDLLAARLSKSNTTS